MEQWDEGILSWEEHGHGVLVMVGFAWEGVVISGIASRLAPTRVGAGWGIEFWV